MIDTIGKPVGRDACTKADECREFFLRRAGIEVEQRRKPLFFSLELSAFEKVGERQRKRPELAIDQPLLRIHVAKIENLWNVGDIGDILRDR